LTTRLYCAALLVAIGAADGAFAASIETAPTPKPSPSFIYLGTPAPAAKPVMRPAPATAGPPAPNYPTSPPAELAAIKFPPSGAQISASVIALGDPGVETMKVAAVPNKPSRPADPVVRPSPAMAGALALTYPMNPPAELTATKFPPPGTQISASVIALGEPGIETMKVAAVTKKSLRPADPVVLRGGVWGDGSAMRTEVALPSRPEPRQPDAAPADVHKEAGAPPSQMPKQPPTTPPAAPAAPPAPRPQAMPAPGVGSVR